jgi:hypothetical protein
MQVRKDSFFEYINCKRKAKQKEGMEVETRVFTISNDQGIYVD